jgi:hypothetical protein
MGTFLTYILGTMKEENARKWCHLYKDGRNNVRDEERCRRLESSSEKF